jgi:hypothetical protein
MAAIQWRVWKFYVKINILNKKLMLKLLTCVYQLLVIENHLNNFLKETKEAWLYNGLLKNDILGNMEISNVFFLCTVIISKMQSTF